MDNGTKVKAAFGRIHAESELVSRTKSAVLLPRRKARASKALIPVLCALALITALSTVFASIYFTPVSMISIDAGSSIELGVNGFGKVVSAKGWGEEGARLAAKLDLNLKSYKAAVESVLDSGEIDENDVYISVAPLSESDQADKITGALSKTTDALIYRCSGGKETVAKAHEAGLSCGKYRAYLELKEIYPEITALEAGSMTVKEMRDMIECHETGTGHHGEAGSGHGGGYGHGYGHGHE